MFVLRLAIPSPLRRYFDYLPPAGTSEEALATLRPGMRLRVPFGPREVTGYLQEVSESTNAPAGSLKPALEILDDVPLIDAQLLQLCQWATAYYHHPPGEVFSAAFPKRLREGKPRQAPGVKGWRLSTRGKGLPPDALGRSPRQAMVVKMLQDNPEIEHRALRDSGISDAVLRGLRDKGLIETCTLSRTIAPPASEPGLALNAQQGEVMTDLMAAGEGFSCHLLEGVTGSGKTEIYLQLIAHCLEQGRQALVLIPEIGLTPQTLGRFQQRFRANIVVLHSGLGDAARYEAWEAARDGSAHIIIGTRSAVFTPLARPGLIVIDEEHDSSYKQQDGFRYSARDVAVKRAHMQGCPILLGSATPSLESIHNALTGRYQHHRLTQRAGSGQLPKIKTVDVRRQQLQAGLSEELLQAIEQKLQMGQQSLLFLNRRGYAPTLQCHDCGWLAECEACDARLTVHRRQRRLRCHHCGSARPLPSHCPSCHGQHLLAAGLGTEQTEDFLRAHFGNWPVYRVDSDSMAGREAMAALVEQIGKGEPCILLGTQMLTKGHHFPGVGLVAVIDTDAMLFSADFRGEERMAQLLTQVAGRAGRAGTSGEVLLQTHYPDHPAMQAMLSRDYYTQARELLQKRAEAGTPPAGQLVVVRTDCADAQFGEQFLQRLRQECSAALPAGAALIGPLPSPMQRRAGKYRSQLLLTAPGRPAAQAAAGVLVARAEALPRRHGLKWSIDIDPQDVF